MFDVLILGYISILILMLMALQRKSFHQIMLADSFYFGILAYYIGSFLSYNFLNPLLDHGIEVLNLSSVALFSATIYYYLMKRKPFIIKNFNNSKNKNLIFIFFIFLVSFNIMFSLLIYRDFFLGNSISQILSGDLLYIRKMISRPKTCQI